MEFSPKWRLAWITGAGKGIGKALVVELSKLGVNVYASARSESDLALVAEACKGYPGKVFLCPLDIRDSVKIKELFDTHFKEQLPDLFVLNAGTHDPFSAQEFSAERAEQLWGVNLMGTARCLEPILKYCIEADAGQVAIMGSVAGYRGLPTAGAYGASKAALINMAESLRLDLLHTKVDLRVINPGFVRTPLTDKNDFSMPALMEPETAAKRIVSGLRSKQFEITFPRRFACFLKLISFLPYCVYFPLVKRMTRSTNEPQ